MANPQQTEAFDTHVRRVVLSRYPELDHLDHLEMRAVFAVLQEAPGSPQEADSIREALAIHRGNVRAYKALQAQAEALITALNHGYDQPWPDKIGRAHV